jgi:hypothetical protein
MHMTLMKYLCLMIIYGHFDCSLSQWLVITNEIGSYEFVGTKNETFLLNEFPTLEKLAGLVREQLGWMDEGFKVWFEGRIDIGSSNGPRIKMMPPMCNDKEWTTYVEIMMKSEIHGI